MTSRGHTHGLKAPPRQYLGFFLSLILSLRSESISAAVHTRLTRGFLCACEVLAAPKVRDTAIATYIDTKNTLVSVSTIPLVLDVPFGGVNDNALVILVRLLNVNTFTPGALMAPEGEGFGVPGWAALS